MPFIPHTEAEIKEMLDAIGVSNIEDLFDEIPAALRSEGLESIPLLRKDFIFDPYQVYEAKAFGADAILLIAAILDDSQMGDLMALAHELGLQCLVEVHDKKELERVIKSNAQVIGINNRDLTTFKVDISTTEILRPLVPANRVVISESGISRKEDIVRLNESGVDAVLIGEALVTSDDITGKLRELL